MKADLILAGGRVLDVERGELKEADLSIFGGCIQDWLAPGNGRDAERFIDVSDRILVPGLMDAHLHIESSMLTPAEFAKAALPRGTTAVFVDPHEIANVVGVRGVEFFLEQAEQLPLDLFVGIPSCVPATHLENAGGTIALEDIRRLLHHPRVYGLAEMMNFPGIVHGLGDARDRVEAAWSAGKIVDGHAPGLAGNDLLTYVSNGARDGIVRIMSDHECTSLEEALEKRRAGMTIALRYGTASKDLDRILPGLWEAAAGDLSSFMLCSDDVSAVELHTDGHVDRILRRARTLLVESAGLDAERAAVEALRMATLNIGSYYRRFLQSAGHPALGTLRVGARANVLVLDSLESLGVVDVLCGGQPAAELAAAENMATVPPELRGSVHVNVSGRDFDLAVAPETAELRVIGCLPDSLLTEEKIVSVSPVNGCVLPDPARDLATVAVFERHGGAGGHCAGLVAGLGLRRGAIASTVAHDSHNLVVAGVDKEDMLAVSETLRDCGGGLAVSVDGQCTALSLSVGGLMSDQPLPAVAASLQKILEAVRQTGSPLENLFMVLSFLSLPVIPFLKITDRGLVDVARFDFVPLEVG